MLFVMIPHYRKSYKLGSTHSNPHTQVKLAFNLWPIFFFALSRSNARDGPKKFNICFSDWQCSHSFRPIIAKGQPHKGGSFNHLPTIGHTAPCQCLQSKDFIRNKVSAKQLTFGFDVLQSNFMHCLLCLHIRNIYEPTDTGIGCTGNYLCCHWTTIWTKSQSLTQNKNREAWAYTPYF